MSLKLIKKTKRLKPPKQCTALIADGSRCQNPIDQKIHKSLCAFHCDSSELYYIQTKMPNGSTKYRYFNADLVEINSGLFDSCYYCGQDLNVGSQVCGNCIKNCFS